jgi:shikimate dehydrogenase
LHEQEARALGMALTYELFDFKVLGLAEDALGPFLRRLRDQGYSGVNVTHPYKQAVMPVLDSVDEVAALVGAVNTVALRDGRLAGYNTDISGFRDSFVQGLPGASLKRVLQLGAGGAGGAVACALLSLGAVRLEILDIRRERAEELAARLRPRFPDSQIVVRNVTSRDTAGLSGVVNTTPIGMAGHPGSPIDESRLDSSMWVVDVVYFPLETQLLRQARLLGCRVLDGSGMVIRQAAQAFQILTGREPDTMRMAHSFHQMPQEPEQIA